MSPTRTAEPDEAGRRALEHALDYMGLQPGQPLLGQKVDIVFIGSCTNSRISDLREAAATSSGATTSPTACASWSCPAVPR